MREKHNKNNIIKELHLRKTEKKYKKLCPDFCGKTEYDNGEYKFIWGVKSQDDLTGAPANLYTINDIELVYSRVKNRYILSIETAYWFHEKSDEIKYLYILLEKFTKYMVENSTQTDAPYRFWMSDPAALFEGENIPEVYTSFRIFVEGYAAVHMIPTTEFQK